MNAPERLDLPDIQSRMDTRDLAIQAVGVKDLRHPVTIRSGAVTAPTIATLTMTVGLPATAKGTHMSRFVELLERLRGPLDVAGFRRLACEMLRRLDASTGAISMRFPWFVTKTAPVSGVRSRLDHDVEWRVQAAAPGGSTFAMAVTAPATSLCPCSKEISAYGAHNQRSLITVDVESASDLTIEELVAIAEASASCEVYGLLKRVDEKYVTERAYDNPKFVEDLVRDVAGALRRDPRVTAWRVEAENFESIHNHSAFARIAGQGGAFAASGGTRGAHDVAMPS